MNASVINRIVASAPEAGHRMRFMRLGAERSLELRELWERAGHVAAYLRGLGVRPGDRIGILAANGLEWVLLDLAALRLKAVTAGFEPGKFEPGDELVRAYDLRLLFCDRPSPAAGARPMSEVARAVDQPGAAPAPAPVSYAGDDVTTLKFTSGTSGTPKAIAATAGSIDSSLRAVQGMFSHRACDDLFVFLPLSLLQQRYWVYSALCFGHDVTISTYEAAFGVLARARPTVVMGVPAFYETAMKHIEGQARRAAGAASATTAATTAATAAALRAATVSLFGDRIRYLWTGSAPAGAAMLRFFDDVGLPIYEGYGLNETCIVAKNHPGASRRGSVGRVLPGKQVLIGGDGIIRVRSDHPVSGRYEYAPPGHDERVFGEDGVVTTADIGALDEDGFLYILGRSDDTIVLDNGKKVIVRPLEEYMRESPAIDDCVVVCRNQTQLVAVVSPSSEPADEVQIERQLALTNTTFADDERIAKVVIAAPFSTGSGMLTSQLKPRRSRIFDAYSVQIDDSEEGIHAR